MPVDELMEEEGIVRVVSVSVSVSVDEKEINLE